MDRRRYVVHSSALPFLGIEKLCSEISSFLHQIHLTTLQEPCFKALTFYWKIGGLIVGYEQQQVMKEEDHQELLFQLSEQLIRKFGNGFSPSTLEECYQFYLVYTSFSKKSGPNEGAVLPQFQAPLTWSHYRLLIYVDSPQARNFYEKETSNSNWSAPLLEHFIKSRLFERLSTSPNKESILRSAQESCLKLVLVNN